MKMNRRMLNVLGVFAFFFMLLLVFPGFADGGIINPYQNQVWELEKLQPEYQAAVPETEGGLAPNGWTAPVTLVQKTAPRLDGQGQWSVSFNSAQFGTPYETIVILAMKDYTNNYTTVWRKEYEGVPSLVTSCEIVSGGEYELSVYVKSSTSGTGYWYTNQRFTIRDDAAHTSLTEKIDQVVRECRASDNWQTALNLHNWLVTHVYYDLTYEYYGADLILRGYGVCDGYAKVYQMMCRRAGIPAYRVTNDTHAWNVLQLDGDWYFVDCTWDDPTDSDRPEEMAVPVSGMETWTYFCLNTELLALNHPRPWAFTNTTAKTCTALDDNYYVRRRDWDGIGNRRTNGSTYSGSIAAQIAANHGGDFIRAGNLGVLSVSNVRKWTLLAYAIGKEAMEIDGFGLVDLDVRLGIKMDEASKEYMVGFAYTVRGYAGEEYTGTLAIPAGITEIQAEAFSGVASSEVHIPGQCTKIGSNAFRGSKVKKIYIPESVTEIDDTAFSECSRVMIFCESDSAASEFATEHGILWQHR